jgi:hypothetical protein
MLAMGTLVSLGEWREGRPRPSARLPRLPTEGPAPDAVERLEQALQVLDPMVSRLLDHGHLDEATETQLLAMLGEMALGEVGLAADRAERLARRITDQRGGAAR